MRWVGTPPDAVRMASGSVGMPALGRSMTSYLRAPASTVGYGPPVPRSRATIQLSTQRIPTA